MRNFSQAVSTALASSVTRPVWLLKLDLYVNGSTETLRFADRPFNLWGTDWTPAVLGWGVIDRCFDPALGELKVSDVTVTLSNEKDIVAPGNPGVSWYLRKADLGRSSATIYLWLDGAGLTPPSGQNQNDLIAILTGTPELTTGVTPRVCPLDIVSKSPSMSGSGLDLGDLLSGRYTRNQWPALPSKTLNGWKPAVFGDGIVVTGIPLARPERVGKITGPAALFDPSTGADHILITFDKSQSVPYPAPCDIYVGDHRLTVRNYPVNTTGSEWMYQIYSPSSGAKFYIPVPMIGGEPLFAPSPDALWPRSDESAGGPYASAEPAMGAPIQFYHGAADTGNPADGYHPGRSGRTIREVYLNGAKLAAGEVFTDDGFGIAWLRSGAASVRSAVGAPLTTRVKYTSVDDSFTTGSGYLRPDQLTASWPYGYNAGSAPCILGDFSVPASGGGAPASSRIGLVNSIRYPSIGARIASVRFVMKYTGLEVSTGNFSVTLFGSTYSFAATELDDGAQIAASGWWVTKDQKGPQFEIWPNNNGYPYTETSPDTRYWDITELSRDVTAEALAHIKSNGGLADTLHAWFSGSQWPSTNSLIVLSVEMEVSYDVVDTILDEPSVTALIGSPSIHAGDIIREFLPQELVGTGFDDAALPSLKYMVDSQQTSVSFIETVAKESARQLKFNGSTGKWDLVVNSSSKSSSNPPPPTGGAADISESALLADETGAPMIIRERPAPERIINHVTVEFATSSGSMDSVTVQDLRSIEIYGVKSMAVSLQSVADGDIASAYAMDILDANSEAADFYCFTFPLGPAVALEPNDILSVTAGMDGLNASKMRVVSSTLDMGDIAGGRISTVTVNARRYSRASKGYGITQFGQAPYGLGQTMEN